MKILIIDDEPHIRQLMRLTLETAGYEVDEAATGEEGLALFKDGSGYDAVLLDQKMPGMDGLHTLVRLIDRDADVRAIMVTAFASVELAVEAMKLGTTDFLRKPMTPDALRAAVAAALSAKPGRTTKAGTVRASGTEMPASGAPAAGEIEVLTLNGYKLALLPSPGGSDAAEHVFRITHHPDGATADVRVSIDPAEVDRVTRLTKKILKPGGSFWRYQAQRLLAAVLWTEGQPPANGQLTLHDISREALDAAEVWTSD